MSTAFLVIRVIVGLGMAAHGSQKLFGWFGGYGIAGTGGFFEGIGFRPGRLFALAAGLGEAGGGLLTFLGLGGPIGPAIIIMVMLVAIGAVHITKGFFSDKGGFELNLLYISAALAIAFAGAGAFSLDRLFGLTVLAQPHQVWFAIAAAAVLAALNLLARRPQSATA